MRRQRQRRVSKVNHGYGAQKASVTIAVEKESLAKVVGVLVDRGYRKGMSYRKTVGRREELLVELGYSRGGKARRSSRVRRSKPSRPLWVSAAERWSRKGDRGTYRRQTTEGRKTGEEARQKELGGRRRLWVR